MRALALILLMLRECLSCPPMCDCKWKSGKDSAVCPRANLSGLPRGLDTSIQLLDLTGNNLTFIGRDAFARAGLLNLQRVYLSKCALKDLDRFAFRFLTNLVELDLSYNLLVYVPSHIFDSITELRELKLTGNPIRKLSNDAFINVPRLIKIELSECRISAIETRAFEGLHDGLEWLKLDKNRLVEVNPTTFTAFTNLHGLELAGNPWNCTCRLRPLRQWLFIQNVPSNSPATCGYPLRLRGKTWDKLDEEEFACPPVLHRTSIEVSAIEGDNTSMSCHITGNPKPNVHWDWKNKPNANYSGIPSKRKFPFFHYTGFEALFYIFSVELVDAGTYFCVASNKAGKVVGNVTLSVSRRAPEPKLSTKALILGGSVAFVFLFASYIVFCLFSKRRRTPRVNQPESYEKIEMENKSEQVHPDNHPSNKVHPTLGEYRGVPTTEEPDEETPSTSVVRPSLHEPDLRGVAHHILHKKVLPTTSLYTTAAAEDRSATEDFAHPSSSIPSIATLPRSRRLYGSSTNSSQSPLLPSSSRESFVSSTGPHPGRPSVHRRRFERSASSLDMYEAQRVGRERTSLPPSPRRTRPSLQESETPILNVLGRARHDYHSAHLDRYIDQYRNIKEELLMLKATSLELRLNPAGAYPQYVYNA